MTNMKNLLPFFAVLFTFSSIKTSVLFSSNPQEFPLVNDFSCFNEAEQKTVIQTLELFLSRMEEYYPDSMDTPFQTFLRQYVAIEIDNNFFHLEEGQITALKQGLPWIVYVEAEEDFDIEIVPPADIQKQVEERDRKLAAKAYPEESIYLDITAPFTTCLYTRTADQDLQFFYKRYTMIGFMPSRSKANLFSGFLKEAKYEEENIQQLIAVEIFLQRCLNTK